MSITEQLRTASVRLAQKDDQGLSSPRLEAELLMARVLGRPRSFLFSHGETTLSHEQANDFQTLLERRLNGEPIAYLTGTRSFWNLELAVDPGVLIPRAETELLVEAALQRMAPDTPLRIVDLGTGSGAIALALASERPDARVIATDVSEAALETARQNAHLNGLERVEFMISDWLSGLRGHFDVVVSNPPYVAIDDPHLDRGDCRFEPRSALTPGPDALGAYRQIVLQSRDHLVRGGWLLFEHGFDQASSVHELLETAGYVQIQTYRDLQGHERVTLGRRPPE